MSAALLPRASLAAALLLSAAAPLASQPTVRLPAADRALAGRAAPVFTASGLEDVGSVAFDARDQLYVLDPRRGQVRVYSPAGALVRTLGGPPALQVPVRMAVLADGGVAVSDMAQQAVVVLGPDGAVRRTLPFARLGGIPALWGMQGHPRGGIVSTVHDRTGRPVLSLSPLTEAGRSVTVHPGLPPQQVRRPVQTGTLRYEASVPLTFAPSLLWTVVPGGEVAVAAETGYRVELRGPSGSRARILTRPVRARAVTARDQERAREERMAKVSGARVFGGPGGAAPAAGGMGAQLTTMAFADSMPAIRGLAADPAGVLWIGRASAVYLDPGPVDLVTPAGAYLGTLPRETIPDAISPGGLAAYVEKTETPRVVVRRIPAEWRPRR